MAFFAKKSSLIYSDSVNIFFRKVWIKMFLAQKKWLENILQSESDARQIRSLSGKIVASNEQGLKIFDSKNPFLFFADTLQPERLEKLKDAYRKKCNIDIRLEMPANKVKWTQRTVICLDEIFWKIIENQLKGAVGVKANRFFILQIIS